MTAAGRDLITGIPQRREISINLVRAAVKEPLEQCVQAIGFDGSYSPGDS